MDVEKNHITFCTSSSNKALASVCGLSFVCGQVAAFESLKDVKSRTCYLNLYNHYRYETQAHQTPNTPNLSVYFALDAALNEVLYEGMHQRYKRHQRFASILRRAMERMGIAFFIPEHHMSNSVTTAWVPAGVPYQRLRDRLKERGFVVYGGKGELADRVFQVANMGNLDEPTIGLFLDALRDVLATANS